MKTPEQRENDMLEAAKNYAQQYEGLMYTIGSIAGVSGIRMAFERGVHFGLHQALDMTVEREKAERNAEQHWISVKERLPEDGQDVLACVNGQVLISYVHGMKGFSSEWGLAENGETIWPSHWMPLPSAPKE